MLIDKVQNNEELTLSIIGRLDTSTAPQLETEIQESTDGVTSLILDFSGLDYISSAGLRVLLSAYKKMQANGGMVIRNVSENVMEIFEITGFSDFLTIKG